MEKADWNTLPRDAAGLTRYSQGALERLLNWQIVRLDGKLEDLMEAPILYLCGQTAWEFSDAEVERLREFCNRGGMMLAVADHDSADFVRGIEALGKRLYPDYAFKPLPANHPLFSGEVGTPIKNPPPLLELSNGLRTLILLSPKAISASWHRYQVRGKEADFQLGVNIYLYATDKSAPRSRLRSPFMSLRPVAIKREIKVARIKYDGLWNPEPFGWERLATYMNNETSTKLVVTPGIALDAPDLDNYNVLHMTGAGAFKLSEAEVKGLRRYLTGGGTLIVDAGGGSREFIVSLDGYLKDILHAEAERLPDTSPLMTGQGLPAGGALKGVTYKRSARRESAGRDMPLLMIYRDKRHVPVIYSPLDLSTALLGTEVYNCRGYEGDSALRIMRNLLMYAQMSAADKARMADK